MTIWVLHTSLKQKEIDERVSVRLIQVLVIISALLAYHPTHARSLPKQNNIISQDAYVEKVTDGDTIKKEYRDVATLNTLMLPPFLASFCHAIGRFGLVLQQS